VFAGSGAAPILAQHVLRKPAAAAIDARAPHNLCNAATTCAIAHAIGSSARRMQAILVSQVHHFLASLRPRALTLDRWPL